MSRFNFPQRLALSPKPSGTNFSGYLDAIWTWVLFFVAIGFIAEIIVRLVHMEHWEAFLGVFAVVLTWIRYDKEKEERRKV